MAFPSMFKYVEKGLGYSPAQASERISAMRLLRKVPEISESLKLGSQTLTSVAKIASHVRRENLTSEAACSLVRETSHQTISALEKYLLGVSFVEPQKIERTKIISAELTRLTLDVNEEFMELVNRVRELHGNPALALSEIFQQAMKEVIKKKDVKSRVNGSATSGAELQSESQTPSPAAHFSNSRLRGPTRTQAVKSSKHTTRYIRVNDRRITFQRAAFQCEFIHEKSGTRCNSRFGLQM
ncbi:MAG: hypothetical protein H7301_02035 [Cryobacterium sp.]|nr:hypothetical protein [Oligoflexia bacterium]